MKALIIEKKKTLDFLEKESFLAMQDAEKKNDMILKHCERHWYLLKKGDLRSKTIT